MKNSYTIYGAGCPSYTVNDYNEAIAEAQEIAEQEGWASVYENPTGVCVWEANETY